MEPKDNQTTLFRRYAIVAVLFLFVMAAVPPLSDYSWEWKKYQKEYFAMAERIETEKVYQGQINGREINAIIMNNLHQIDKCIVCHVLPKQEKMTEEIPELTNKEHTLKIRQIIVSEERVDRCTTCHLGIENPDFENEKQPFRTHPNLDQHPLERFGCTLCHAGQGRATSKDAAHGHVPFWEAPMLPLEYIQSSCGKCHLSQDIPGAPDLSEGRLIYLKKRCKKCHKIGKKGGSMGPDLTHEGRYGHRDPEWLFEHFINPKAFVSDSSMPDFHFTDQEAKALTMYMLSLTDENITGYLGAKKIIPDITTGKSLFQEKGCIGCHSINGKGGRVGPDLTDVAKRRESDWIFRHFKNPRKVSPGTVMPKFDFDDDEARALTMYVLSLSEESMIGYIKKPKNK